MKCEHGGYNFGCAECLNALLAQAKSDSYKEGYYEGEKNEFHNNNFNISKTIKHIIEGAKKEERNRIAEVVQGMKLIEAAFNSHSLHMKQMYNQALEKVLAAIAPEEKV